jgi:hypothetical protein
MRRRIHVLHLSKHWHLAILSAAPAPSLATAGIGAW